MPVTEVRYVIRFSEGGQPTGFHSYLPQLNSTATLTPYDGNVRTVHRFYILTGSSDVSAETLGIATKETWLRANSGNFFNWF